MSENLETFPKFYHVINYDGSPKAVQLNFNSYTINNKNKNKLLRFPYIHGILGKLDCGEQQQEQQEFRPLYPTYGTLVVKLEGKLKRENKKQYAIECLYNSNLIKQNSYSQPKRM